MSEQRVDEKAHRERVVTSVDVECPACRRRAIQVALNDTVHRPEAKAQVADGLSGARAPVAPW